MGRVRARGCKGQPGPWRGGTAATAARSWSAGPRHARREPPARAARRACRDIAAVSTRPCRGPLRPACVLCDRVLFSASVRPWLQVSRRWGGVRGEASVQVPRRAPRRGGDASEPIPRRRRLITRGGRLTNGRGRTPPRRARQRGGTLRFAAFPGTTGGPGCWQAASRRPFNRIGSNKGAGLLPTRGAGAQLVFRSEWCWKGVAFRRIVHSTGAQE